MLGINQEDEVTKCTEEMESLPNMQMPAFPFLDLNGVSDIVQWIIFLLLFCPKSYANSTVVYVLLYMMQLCVWFSLLGSNDGWEQPWGSPRTHDQTTDALFWFHFGICFEGECWTFVPWFHIYYLSYIIK